MKPTVSISDNERVVLDVVRRNEPVVRSAIAHQTPFTQPGVHRILESLVAQHLVTVGQAKANGPGKPSPELHLNRSRYFSLGIEVSTSAIDVCLVNTACEPTSQTRLVEPVSRRDPALAAVHQVALEMLAEQGRSAADLIGIGLGISGFFVNGTVNAPEPLEDWSLINLHDALARHFDAATWVTNSATTAAIGESLLGVGRTTDNFAYLAFNYGFGGGVIVNGRPHFGVNGNAMEISGLYTEDELPNRPALQYLIAELERHGRPIKSIEQLQEDFDPTWPGVESWVERTLPQLNLALRAILSTLDPDVIVLGGEIPEALADIFIERASLRGSSELRYGVAMPVPELVYSQAARIGPALGAATLPLKATIYP